MGRVRRGNPEGFPRSGQGNHLHTQELGAGDRLGQANSEHLLTLMRAVFDSQSIGSYLELPKTGHSTHWCVVSR